MKRIQAAKPATLRDLREARALTMRDVGIDPCTLVQLEKGRRSPLPKTIRRLAKVYKVEIADVIAAVRASAGAA
jgi:transcriptional regulator with XRE-family HTH domain